MRGHSLQARAERGDGQTYQTRSDARMCAIGTCFQGRVVQHGACRRRPLADGAAGNGATPRAIVALCHTIIRSICIAYTCLGIVSDQNCMCVPQKASRHQPAGRRLQLWVTDSSAGHRAGILPNTCMHVWQNIITMGTLPISYSVAMHLSRPCFPESAAAGLSVPVARQCVAPSSCPLAKKPPGCVCLAH